MHDLFYNVIIVREKRSWHLRHVKSMMFAL